MLRQQIARGLNCLRVKPALGQHEVFRFVIEYYLFGIVDLLHHFACGFGKKPAMPLLIDLCDTMRDGSLCALGGFTPYPVISALTHFPDDFARHKEAAE